MMRVFLLCSLLACIFAAVREFSITKYVTEDIGQLMTAVTKKEGKRVVNLFPNVTPI